MGSAESLVTGGPFKPAGVFSHSLVLEENGHEAFEYYGPTDAVESRCLTLTIHAFGQTQFGLTDEAAYHGRFPGKVAPTDAPQVWEVRGRATKPDSYQRDNGVFKNGVLVRGSKTFHSSGNVEFRPTGTTDIVYGYFKGDEMQDLEPDVQHATTGPDAKAGSFRPDAPAWLRNTYLVHVQQYHLARQAAKAQHDEQYRRDHLSVPTSHPRPGYQPTEHEVACYVCGGSGWVSGRACGTRD